MITYFEMSSCWKSLGKRKSTQLVLAILFAFAFASTNFTYAQSGNTGGTLGKTNKSLSGRTKKKFRRLEKKWRQTNLRDNQKKYLAVQVI